MYEYKCKLERVIDGSTIDAEVDLGFNVFVKQRIRLYGIETPSIQGTTPDEREQGVLARSRLIELLPKFFIVKTILNSRGKYGRVMGYIYVIDDAGIRTCINEVLVDEGIAKAYDLKK